MFLVIYLNVPFLFKEFSIAHAFMIQCAHQASVIDDWDEDINEIKFLTETQRIWNSKNEELLYYKLEITENIPSNVNTLVKSFPF